MKNINTFEDFINESYLNEAMDISINKIIYMNKIIPSFDEFVNEQVNRLNEYSTRSFKVYTPSPKDLKGAEKWLKKYMSRTEKTIEEATKRIKSFDGGSMFTHIQYHIVKPNGNKPDRPTFRLHQSQEWLNDANLRGREEVNATYLTIYQLKDGENVNTSQGDAWDRIGQTYVDTKAFLNELGVSFEITKTVS